MNGDDRQVLIRVDAGMGIGFGHLSRCLALARHFTDSGVSVTVATRGKDPQTQYRIGDAGASILALDGGSDTEAADGPVWATSRQMHDARMVIEKRPPGGWDAVVVDHYRLDSTWESEIAAHATRVAVIDDLANREHTANVVVDHNWYGDHNASRYDGITVDETMMLLGPRFAMLHREYATARQSRTPARVPPRNVLVSFGGTDVGKQTLKAVTALTEFPEVRIDAVLGTQRALSPELAHLAEHPRVTLHMALPDLVERLAEADVVFGAGGTATWERLCMGAPAIVTTVSENQSGVTRALHNAGLTRWLGTSDHVSTDDYRIAMQDAMAGDIPTALPIIDGNGAARVGLAILPPDAPSLTARPAASFDGPSYVTAGPDRNRGPLAWRARAERFSALREAGSLDILEVGRTPVGVRETNGGTSDVWLDAYIHHDYSVQEAP